MGVGDYVADLLKEEQLQVVGRRGSRNYVTYFVVKSEEP